MKKLLTLTVLLITMMMINVDVSAQKVYDFVAVEKTPEYPGGMKKFYEYLGKNLKYPPVAKANKTSGRVFLTFIVEESGKLSDIKVIRGLSKETDAEAVRVLKESPKWNPGIIKRQPVRVRYNITVNFSDNPANAPRKAR